jgi:hypothetical protein
MDRMDRTERNGSALEHTDGVSELVLFILIILSTVVAVGLRGKTFIDRMHRMAPGATDRAVLDRQQGAPNRCT